MKISTLLKTLVYSLTVMIVISSCSSGSNVVDNSLIQKRKYRKGFHLNLAKSNLNDKLKKESSHSIGEKEEVIAQLNRETAPATFAEKAQVKKLSSGNIAAITETIKDERPLGAKVKKLFSEPLEIGSSNKHDAPKPVLETKTTGKGTIMGSYQKKGRIALLASLLFGVLPYAAITLMAMGFPVIGFLAGVAGFTCFLVALILGIGSFKYSKAAKWAVFFSILFLLTNVGLIVLLVL